MSQPISDAAFELIGACIHSLRFAFGAPLAYPYAPAPVAEVNPPDAFFRRIQAVSPPPGREGDPWTAGMTLDGAPFRPDPWSPRLADVRHDEGIPSLDPADPDDVVLHEWFSVERQEEPQTVAFPGADRGRYLTSIAYWTPIPPQADKVDLGVDYYGTYRMPWSRPPRGEWVALSFEDFLFPERDSADLIIPLRDCDATCPV